MPVGEHYTTDEWDEISRAASFDAVDGEQLLRLHRHWLWADHARSDFDDSLAGEGWDPEDFASRRHWAMYIWYSLLYAVIAGYTRRRITLRGSLKADIRSLREPMRDARNATLHVEEDREYYDGRLIEIARSDAALVRRVHHALGQLLLDEMRRRGAAEAPGLSDPPGG